MDRALLPRLMHAQPERENGGARPGDPAGHAGAGRRPVCDKATATPGRAGAILVGMGTINTTSQADYEHLLRTLLATRHFFAAFDQTEVKQEGEIRTFEAGGFTKALEPQPFLSPG
jgi:hypothetical protein